MNQLYFSSVVGDVGSSSQAQVLTERHDGAFQSQVAKLIEARFKQQKFELASTQTLTQLQANSSVGINLIVVFLLIMAVLLAVVGGLGLMGTMSINVLERTREIGVMRAIGASSGAILRIVLVEGVLIGVVSWLLGVMIALPFSKLLDEAVGQAFLKASPSYVFSTTGALLWLGIVIVLAAVSSALPAWNASRITVRDVLAYE